MIQHLHSFLTLFGSMSAILIAFLVILYNSIKSWLDLSKSNLIGEIKNCFECKVMHSHKVFNTNDENIFNDIKTRAFTGVFNVEHSEFMLNHLKNIKIDTLTSVDKSHIQKYHTIDLEAAIHSYEKSFALYNKFPKTVVFSIGVPLFITSLFIIFIMFESGITDIIGKKCFEWLIFLLSLSGIIFIFIKTYLTLYKVQKVNQ